MRPASKKVENKASAAQNNTIFNKPSFSEQETRVEHVIEGYLLVNNDTGEKFFTISIQEINRFLVSCGKDWTNYRVQKGKFPSFLFW